MKLNFKSILVIFLVGLLGGVTGTFGVLEINKATGNKIIEQDSSVVLTEVNYPNIEKSDYSIVISKAYNSVVEITSTIETQSFFGNASSYSLGSGVIVSSDGYIVTNNHVVEGATAVSVKLYDGTDYNATIVGTDEKSDLAVIKIEATNLQYAALADSSELILGQECVVIGNPLGKGISCSNGIISALEKEITINNYLMTVIQTNAAVNEGNSGGGLFNMNGDLIGIVNAKSSGSTSMFTSSASVEGMGYAIPSNRVSKIVQDLVDYGYVKERATMGVSIYSQAVYDQKGVKGVMIATVSEGSAADKAGLKQYDIIQAVDGKQVESYAALSNMLENYEVGDEVELTIYRGYEQAVKTNSDNYTLTPLTIKLKLQEAIQVNTESN